MPHLKDAEATSGTKLSLENDRKARSATNGLMTSGGVTGSSVPEESLGTMKRHFEEKKEEEPTKASLSRNGSGQYRPGGYPGQVTPSPYADGRMYPPYPPASHHPAYHHPHWHHASSAAAAAGAASRNLHSESPSSHRGFGAAGARKLFPTSPIRTGIFRGKETEEYAKETEEKSKGNSKFQTETKASFKTKDMSPAEEKRNASDQNLQRFAKDMRDKATSDSSVSSKQQRQPPDYGHAHFYHAYDDYRARRGPPPPPPAYHHPYYASHPYEHYPPPPMQMPHHLYGTDSPSHPQRRKRAAPEESPPYSPVTSRSKKNSDSASAKSLSNTEKTKSTTKKSGQASESASDSNEKVEVRAQIEEEESEEAKKRQRVISPSSSAEADKGESTSVPVAGKSSAETDLHTEPPRIKRLHASPPPSAHRGAYPPHHHPHSAPHPRYSHYPPYSAYPPYPGHPHDSHPPPPPGYYPYPPASGYPPSSYPPHPSHHHAPPPPPPHSGYPGMPMYPPPHPAHGSPVPRYYPPGASNHPTPPGSLPSASTPRHHGAHPAGSSSESSSNKAADVTPPPTMAATPPETKKALASTASALLKKEEEDIKASLPSTTTSKSAEVQSNHKLTAQEQQSQIQSVKEWQEATLATGKAPSANRCVALTGPIPTKFWGEAEKTKDEPIPDFHTLVNYPDYMTKSRTQQNNSSNVETLSSQQTESNKRHCVMCGKARLSSASAASSVAGRGSGRGGRKSQDDSASMTDNGDFDSDDKTMHIIPRQNKGLCTACDVTVWVISGSGLEIKWCKGCKNFRPWAAFGDKGLATKCVRCRDRQREKYALQKDEIKLRRLRQEKSMISSTTTTTQDDNNNSSASPTSFLSHPQRVESHNGSSSSSSSKKTRPSFSSTSEEKKDDDDDGINSHLHQHHHQDLAAAQGLHSLLAATSKITK